jgi:hypothetical protein
MNQRVCFWLLATARFECFPIRAWRFFQPCDAHTRQQCRLALWMLPIMQAPKWQLFSATHDSASCAPWALTSCSGRQRGWTPLHMAVSNNQLEVVQLLVAGKADLDAQTKESPHSLGLHVSASNANTSISIHTSSLLASLLSTSFLSVTRSHSFDSSIAECTDAM